MNIERALYASEYSMIPAVRKRVDVAICILVLTKSLYFIRKNIHDDDSIYCWYSDELNRVFWGNINKTVHSLRLPYCIKENENIEIIYPTIKGKFKYEYLDELLTLFQAIKANAEVMNCIESLDYEFSDMLQQHEITDRDDVENLWMIFLSLCSYEPCYLRYDHDERNSNGILHPEYHLDINYSKIGTYKLGLNQELTIEQFEDILNSTTGCSILNV